MMKLAVALCALGWTAAANAAPTYLSCEWSNGEVDLAIDEANQRMTIARPKVPVVSLPAIFSPTEVKATERVGGETMTWIVSRTDLFLTTLVTFSPTARKGACKLKPTPEKRAF